MSALRIGVIADTHGLLRPQASAALAGSDHILHAGDVGRPEILDALRALAPVHAIRGNVDHGAWADALPDVLRLELGGLRILMLHDLKQLGTGIERGDAQLVVAGHSHVPRHALVDGVRILNPGSAGPRRFRLPVSTATLHVDAGRVEVRIVDLLDGTVLA